MAALKRPTLVTFVTGRKPKENPKQFSFEKVPDGSFHKTGMILKRGVVTNCCGFERVKHPSVFEATTASAIHVFVWHIMTSMAIGSCHQIGNQAETSSNKPSEKTNYQRVVSEKDDSPAI